MVSFETQPERGTVVWVCMWISTSCFSWIPWMFQCLTQFLCCLWWRFAQVLADGEGFSLAFFLQRFSCHFPELKLHGWIVTCNRNGAAPSSQSIQSQPLKKLTLKASISSRWSLTWRPHTRTWPVQTEKLLKRKSPICRESIFKFNYGCNVITEGRQCWPGSLFLHYGSLGIVCSFGEALSISVGIYKETPLPPLFCLLTTKVQTKTMFYASFESLTFGNPQTAANVTFTPPSRCLTFRFGGWKKKKKDFLRWNAKEQFCLEFIRIRRDGTSLYLIS